MFTGPAGYELGDLRNWADWARTGATPAARLVRYIEDHDLAGLGACPVPLLPALDRTALNAVLTADDGAFLARPVWNGAPHLAHPLGRRAHHPLVAALMFSHGTGVLPLLAARLADLQAGLDEAEGLVKDCWGRGRLARVDAGGEGNVAAGETPALPAQDTGHGLGDAARGLLVHRVELDGDTIARYQILAPTEWTFHPDGALACGLRGRPANVDHARLLVAALDPCVTCTIEV